MLFNSCLRMSRQCRCGAKLKSRLGIFIASLTLIITVGGCSEKFLDPGQVGRFRPVPAVNVILDSLSVAEETPAAWETGDEPKPADVIAYDTDYVFGSGDIVIVSIFELFNEGLMYTNQFVITETGKISIPDIGAVEATGLTESQLEEEIRQVLSPNIIKTPSVNVTLVRSQSKMFSILGNGIPRPGRYEIPRYDFRLADALATAGGISQFNISYVYVSRPITGQEELIPGAPETPAPVETPKVGGEKSDSLREKQSEDDMLDVIAPMAKNGRGANNKLVITSTELATADELNPEERLLNEQESAARDSSDQIRETKADSRIEWIFRDGRWVPMQIGPAQGAEEQAKPTLEPGQRAAAISKEAKAPGWEQIGTGGAERRVVRIPADKLLSGDSRYNIVVRAGDNIHVPVDIIGEFCIMGNVNNQGFINITGRPMTLKMAVAAAGGLGPLAWPKKCEIVRRIGKKREEIVMVDLDKIAMGEQPDFFIKPNDLINVGTHPTSQWRAVLRNAFRATYGFGFIYDRNFADRDFGTGRPFDFLF